MMNACHSSRRSSQYTMHFLSPVPYEPGRESLRFNNKLHEAVNFYSSFIIGVSRQANTSDAA